MHIEDFKKLKRDMRIRISDDPSYSIQKHGALDGYKRKLAGTLQTIKRVSKVDKRVYINSNKYDTVSFNIRDIELENFNPHTDLPKIESTPQLFDPDKLML